MMSGRRWDSERQEALELLRSESLRRERPSQPPVSSVALLAEDERKEVERDV